MEQLTLIAFIVALGLASAVGLQTFYLFFLEMGKRQQARRIAELERENAALTQMLRDAESALERIKEPRAEAWPEFVEDDRANA